MASRAKRKRLARMKDTNASDRAAPGRVEEAAAGAALSAPSGDAGAPADGVFYRDCYIGGIDKGDGSRKAVSYEERRVDVIASTETIDSHGEIVEQTWLLDRYLRNPVILWNHNSPFQSDKKPIGRAENVRIENPGTAQAALKMSIIFASAEANPEAERILLLFVEGIQRAVSVGFRPTEIRSERIDDKDVTILAQNVLLEVSATPIGANPDALAEQRSAERRFIARKLGDKRFDDATPEGAYEFAARVIEQSGNTITANSAGDAESWVTIGDTTNGEITLRFTNPPADERGGSHQDTEPEMDLKEMQAALEKTEAERDEANARADAIETQNEKLVAERDEAKAELAKLHRAAVEAEVKALVGVKFTPAELEDQVELALSNRELFDKLTAQRSEMTLLDKDPAGMGAPPAPKRPATNGKGEGLANLTTAAAAKRAG